MVSKTFFVIAALCFWQAIAKPGGEKEDNLQKLSTQVQTYADNLQKGVNITETKESEQIAEANKEAIAEPGGEKESYFLTMAKNYAKKYLNINETKEFEQFVDQLKTNATLAIPKSGGDKDDDLKKLATQVQTVFNTFHAGFQKVLNIKETKESKQIADQLKTNANEMAGKLSELLTEVNKEVKVHSGKVDIAIEALKIQVSETVEKLQKQATTEAAKAQEYQKQIEATYTDLVTKAKEAANAIAKDTSGVQEDLHKFTENVIKEVKTNMEKINIELKKNIEEHKKEHKH